MIAYHEDRMKLSPLKSRPATTRPTRASDILAFSGFVLFGGACIVALFGLDVVEVDQRINHVLAALRLLWSS